MLNQPQPYGSSAIYVYKIEIFSLTSVITIFQLGETICPMKEDFIMVHLQHACSHCCILMVSGNRWVCDQCKNFQICDK